MKTTTTRYKCDTCGHTCTTTETETVELPHEHTVDPTARKTVKNAQCNTAAVYQDYCACGEPMGDPVVGETLGGHLYSGTWTDDDPNAGEVGTHSDKCTRNETQCDDSPNYGVKSEPHNYTSEETVQVGDVITTTYTCGGCGHKYSKTTYCDHQEHNSVREIRPATCTEPAVYRNWCEDCQAFYGVEFTQGGALGHAWSIRVVDAYQHEHVCGRDSAHNYMEDHSFGEWSEWVNNARTRVCADCQYEQVELRIIDVPAEEEPVVTPPVVTPPAEEETPVVAPAAPAAPVTPAPAEDEEIEDNETPLTNGPEAVEPVEEPAVEPVEEPAEEEDIDDNETPLTDAPVAVEPVEEPAEEDVVDSGVPLADVPKTSDLSVVWYGVTALSALGLTVLGKKKEEDDD